MLNFFDLQSILRNTSKIKLPGGMVGKVCKVLIVVALSIAAIAWSVRILWVSALSIVLIFILVFVMLWRVVNFANKNPQAAILEGAEFLLYSQLMLGTKANPQLTALLKNYIEAHSITLPEEPEKSMEPDPIINANS
jgi:hypothetical protein